MFKKLKKSMATMNEEIENLSEEIGVIERNQKEILELKVQ